MDNNRVVGIVITGDAKGLQQTLDAAGKQVGDFGKKVQTFEQAWAQGHSKMQALNSSTALSAKQLQFSMAGLPAQITDIFTSLQAGQRPLTVLLQQGGQLKDMFGGIVPAFRAVGGYLLGLVSPLTALATGLAALGIGYYQAGKQADSLAKSIILTGGAAGITTGELQAMAERMDYLSGVTRGGATEALVEFVSAGAASSQMLESFAATAMRFARNTDESLGDIAKNFAELSKNPTEASEKLTQKYRYLTAAVYDQIKALEEQGRRSEASALAQKSYADALDEMSGKMEARLGNLEWAWKKVSGGVRDFGDALAGLFRGQFEEGAAKLAKIDQKLAEARAAYAKAPNGMAAQQFALEIKRLTAERDALLPGVNADKKAAADKKALADKTKFNTDWRKLQDEFLRSEQRMERELAQARATAQGAGLDPDSPEVKKTLDNIRRKYRSDDAIALHKAQLDRAIDVIRKSAEEEVDIEQDKQKRLDATRTLGLVTDADYFKQKAAFIEAEKRIKAQAVADEIALLEKQKFAKPEDAEANQRRINDLRATERKLQRETLLEGDLLTSKMTEAEHKRMLAVMSVTQALEMRLEQQRRAGARALAEMGMSDRDREYSSGVGGITDHYASEISRLNKGRAAKEATGSFNADAQREYDEILAALKAKQAEELAEYQKNYASKRAMQEDWAAGAKVAMQNYADSTRDVFASVGQLVTRAFKGMEDALVQFVRTGKLDFRSLADSIISDLIRIQIQRSITGPLAASLSSGNVLSSFAKLFSAKGNAFTSAGAVQAFANGGAFTNSIVSQPTVFPFAKGVGLMGEAGPEAIMPLKRLSGGRLGVSADGAGAANVTVNIIESPSGGGQVNQRQQGGETIIDVVVAKVKASVAGDIMRGSGEVSNALSSTYGLNRAAGAY